MAASGIKRPKRKLMRTESTLDEARERERARHILGVEFGWTSFGAHPEADNSTGLIHKHDSCRSIRPALYFKIRAKLAHGRHFSMNEAVRPAAKCLTGLPS